MIKIIQGKSPEPSEHTTEENGIETGDQCEQCDYVGEDHNELKQHIEKNHKVRKQTKSILKPKKIKCDNCHKAYSSRSLLEKHNKSVHPDLKLQCGLCKNVFSTPEDLKQHMSDGHDEIKHKCQKCDYQCKTLRKAVKIYLTN